MTATRTVLLLSLLTLSAPAADRYVRPGAAGSGSDWSDAYGALPATLVRGDTYWLADGSYGSYRFDDAISGTLAITVRKATAAAHGTSAGWSTAYGDGQAVFSGWQFHTDHYVLDGAVRNSDWRTGGVDRYGISTGNVRIDNGAGTGGDQLTFRRIDMHGGGRDTGAGDDVLYGLTGNSGITISECAMRDTDRCMFVMRGTWRDLLVEHCYLARNTSTPAIHAELVSTTDSDRVTFRYNAIEDIEGTAVFAFINDGIANDWRVYGNTIIHTAAYAADTGRKPGHNFGITGIIFGANDASNDNTCNNFKVYNNTIANIKGLWSGVIIQKGSGNQTWNNLWYDCVRTNNGGGGQVFAGNWYRNTQADGDTSASRQTSTSGSVFVDASARNFHLVSATLAGSTLASPFDRDADGAVRGGDGVWDRGAFEFGGTTPPTDVQAPTVPANLTASAISSSRIDLAWSASTDAVGVAGYRVFRGGVQVATVTSGTTWSNTGLTAATTYSYTVAAYDAAVNVSAQSAARSATTLAAPDTTPPVISAVSASRITARAATIAWTTNEPADSQVQYGRTTDYGSSSVLDARLVTAHSVSLTGLAKRTTYFYRILSRDAAGNFTTSASGSFRILGPDSEPPVTSVGAFAFTTADEAVGGERSCGLGAGIALLGLAMLLSRNGRTRGRTCA